jgi:transcriptional regulator with XRE-family HTH domain
VAAQGDSQQQLGEMVDISQGQISQYLRGERSLLIDEFEDISVALGFTATEVLDLAITLRASETKT